MGNLSKQLNESISVINENFFLGMKSFVRTAFDALHSSREDYIYMIPSQHPKEVKQDLAAGLSGLVKDGYVEYDNEVDHDDEGRAVGSEDYFWFTDKGMALDYDDFESYFTKPSSSKPEYSTDILPGMDEEEKNIHSNILVRNATDLARTAVRKLDNAVRTGVVGAIYPNFEAFMADIWTNLPWTPEGMKVALEWILTNPSAMWTVKAVKDKFNYDLESEIKDELKDAREAFQSQYNEEIDEAKEDRRSQIVDYLMKNPGATVADMGRAIWNRDIDTLGRTSTLVITIVRSIASALKSGAIRRDETKKPYKYYPITGITGTMKVPVKQPVVTTPVTKTTTPIDILSALNKEWSYGTWQGGPKYFDSDTSDRGPRTDHGGGEDGDEWMDDEQLRQVKAPYIKKWAPRLEDLKTRLKKYGIQAEVYVDYGEKGHISLHVTVK